MSRMLWELAEAVGAKQFNDMVPPMAGQCICLSTGVVAIVLASARANWPYACPGPGRSLVLWTSGMTR